jgi:Tetratricopeptide repeat
VRHRRLTLPVRLQPPDIQLPGRPLVTARQPAEHLPREGQQPGLDLRDLLRSQRVGRLDEALGCDQDSVALFRQLGDRIGQAGSLTNLGETYELLERFHDSLACQRDSLGLFRDLGDRPGGGAQPYSFSGEPSQFGRNTQAQICAVPHSLG